LELNFPIEAGIWEFQIGDVQRGEFARPGDQRLLAGGFLQMACSTEERFSPLSPKVVCLGWRDDGAIADQDQGTAWRRYCAGTADNPFVLP